MRWRKPSFRFGKKGKLRFNPGGVSLGGKGLRLNLSKRGASVSSKVGPIRQNSRRGTSCSFVLLAIATLLLATGVGLAQQPFTVYLPIITGGIVETRVVPEETPTPTVTATSTTLPDTPTTTATATATTGGQFPPVPCLCTADLYNCADFENHSAAQACFDHCMVEVGKDIHKLDQNNDFNACESLPFEWKIDPLRRK